jgi:hypothetical protein
MKFWLKVFIISFEAFNSFAQNCFALGEAGLAPTCGASFT